ncbi:MAG: type II toxin-antitoxin system RelB/DinJ family antitoxin [Bacillota bacterium]|nr:type II toxin-antitoxin system RelB/DinJ family antitoxin [Bacillota bacterium]
MAQSTFSVRMDENLKKEFEKICNDFGMNMSVAINVFARAVVRERKIPFEIYSVSEKAKEGLELLESFKLEAIKNGTANLTLDEINEEIRLARESK